MVVTSYRFLDEDTSGTTNLPLPIEKVPQSISLVNVDFIKAADLKTLGEVAQYTAGALFSGNKSNFAANVMLRGFDAGFAINGLPILRSISEPDTAFVERLEIAKGPASVVYGAASPGGVANLVLKSPSARTPNYVSVLGGSWNRLRVEGQYVSALNASGTVRGIVVGTHEQADSFIHYVNSSRTGGYLGLDFDLADNVKGEVRLSYEKFRRTRL